MKTFVHVIIAGIFIMITSCGTNKDRQQDINGKDYDYAYMIPDSLKTPEQKKLVDTFYQLIADGVYIENNQWHFKYTRADFEKHNVPQAYYDVFMKNINEVNKGIKE